MHSAIRIVGGDPKSRSNISIRSHQHGSTFPYPIGSLELLANKVGLVAQKRSERRRRPNGALPARQQDHGTFKQIENGPRALIAQDPDMWCSTAGTRGGNVIVDLVGDLGRHRAIADKCASLIDDSEILSESRSGAPAVRDQIREPGPTLPEGQPGRCRRLRLRFRWYFPSFATLRHGAPFRSYPGAPRRLRREQRPQVSTPDCEPIAGRY